MPDLSTEYRVQPADPDAVELLPAIEAAAAALFPPEDLAPAQRQQTAGAPTFARAARAGRLWTANVKSDGRPVGFALVTIVDGSAHLYEIDVLPEHGRRGLGTALVGAVVAWARQQGFPSVTLTTFRHLPWNGPFYRRLGFEEVPAAELTPELAGHLEEEVQRGLDPAKRVAMRLALSPP
jgi:GNAT superfamily N-acetyltransferase